MSEQTTFLGYTVRHETHPDQIADRKEHIARLVRQAISYENRAYSGATPRERNKLLREAAALKAGAQRQCATHGIDYATILG